jgi:hypothetical protein
MNALACFLLLLASTYAFSFHRLASGLNRHRSQAIIPDDIDTSEKAQIPVEKLSTSSIIEQIFAATHFDSKPKVKALNIFGAEKLTSCQRPNSRSESWRYNNLFEFFSRPYSAVTTSDSSTYAVVQDQVKQLVNTACEQSHYVFIDGRFVAELSSPTASSLGDKDLSFLPLSNTNEELFSTHHDLLAYLPDTTEKQRDSYSSDVMTALNLVR